MDVVLFGPPKETSSLIKDVAITCLFLMALTGFVYARWMKKRYQKGMERMSAHMESAAAVEKELKRIEMDDPMMVSRLKEEVEILRNELQRAEVELEDKCWVAPLVLQHWLQLTFELESATYNAKRKAAEEQLELAKDMCEKLKKKRSSLVGAFVSTHGRSIDDVDRSILEAKTALLEVTKDLQERTERWRQIEILCGCSIMTNPGYCVLIKLVRYVGAGRSGARLGGSRLSNSPSQDDLFADDIDAHSVAASSSHMTSVSSQIRGGDRQLPGSSAASVSGLSTKGRRSKLTQMSRESSKESSSSSADEQPSGMHMAKCSVKKKYNNFFFFVIVDKKPVPHMPGPASVTSSVTRTPPLPAARKISPRIGPNGRMMVKSLSQDAGSQMAVTAASVLAASATTASSTNVSSTAAVASIPNSVSDTQITASAAKSPSPSAAAAPVVTSKPPLPQSHSSASVASSSVASTSPTGSNPDALSTSASQPSLRPPTVEEESYSDSGSMASELDANGKKIKKKRSFFNFRRKKEKIP